MYHQTTHRSPMNHLKHFFLLGSIFCFVYVKSQCPVTLAMLSFNPNKAKYCYNDNITITLNPSNSYTGLNWTFTGPRGSVSNSPPNVFNIIKIFGSGQLTVTGNAFPSGGGSCGVNLTTYITLDPPMTVEAGANAMIGSGITSANLGGAPTVVSGGTSPFTYAWSPATGLSSASVANPVATPASTTNYQLTVTDQYNCTAQDQVTVYNISTITNNKHYAILRKKLDAGYYNSVTVGGTKYFYFKFEEEYYTPGTNLTYKVFDDGGSLQTGLPTLAENMGDNRFALNLTGLTVAAYYKVYVYNQKNEVWEGRLKVN